MYGAEGVLERSSTVADAKARLTGAAAIGFAVVVVAQNFIRGGSAPANDASTDEVVSYYADHRAITFVLAASFVIGGACLAVFLGGAVRRLVAGPRPAWAYTGLVGGIGIIALFSVLVACENALSVVAHGTHPDAGAVDALWALHNSVFTVLLIWIGVALFGLARAGVAAGITPPAFDRLAPVGAALLVVSAVAGPAIAAGEAMAFFGLGALGFVIWLAFLVATGRRLVSSAVA